jgi:hypothetical protein
MVLFLYAACVLAGCTQKKAPPSLDIAGLAEDIAADGGIHMAAPDDTDTYLWEAAGPEKYRRTDPVINILWGVHPMIRGNGFTGSPSTGGPIFDYLNEKYNISLKAMRMPKNIFNAVTLPDIFYTDDPAGALKQGLTRTIPRLMIERYAPNYARLLYAEPLGWRLNAADNGEYTGLCTYDCYYEWLDIYSVYRLDWLEKLGVMPHGDMKMIEDRVYFTDAAFYKKEFTNIMQMFSRDDAALKETKFTHNGVPDIFVFEAGYWENRTRGFEFNNGYFAEIMPLMGMFGLNTTVVNDGGIPMPYYASNQFKAFLLYAEDLATQGTVIAGRADNNYQVFIRGSSPKAYSVLNITGHWNDDFYYLFSNIDAVLRNVPEARILITPPEIGDEGLSGVGKTQSHPYGIEGAWVIGSWVDDEKLARILELFDGLSCDTEDYLAANYGASRFINEKARELETVLVYNWAQEPYKSRIKDRDIKGTFMVGAQMFSTNVFDENTARLIYFIGQNALSDYAVSATARERLLWPFKEDQQGVYTNEKVVLDEAYAQKLQQMAWKYFYETAVTGWTGDDVASTWDGYLQSLRENGLQSYIALYKKYP